MRLTTKSNRTDRHPSESYEDILDKDTRPAPVYLREQPSLDVGLEPVLATRYTSPDFARSEEAHLWTQVWQMSCREEEIPNPGDTYIYDIAGHSILVTRQMDGKIRGFHNSCLHRGRKLATHGGCKAEFRCPFHGFTWKIDGSFSDNPIAWDFPQWRDADLSLPEVKVATWAGFVFINLDQDAPVLDDVIRPLQNFMAPYDYENTYIHFHVEKLIPANWKAVAEAFMESHHSIATHRQLLAYITDVNSQYDILSDHVSRQISANLVASPFAPRKLTENEILGAMLGAGARVGLGDQTLRVPEGSTARAFMAERSRRLFAEEDGYNYDQCSDAEMLDALIYNVFPNFSVWGGFRPNLVYRWRPNGSDPSTSIMDIYQLKRLPKGKPRPQPASVFKVGLDESITEFGPKGGMPPGLAAILEQDMGNMPQVQEGLAASATGLVHFSRYSEMRLRLQHQMIDRYIAKGRAKAQV